MPLPCRPRASVSTVALRGSRSNVRPPPAFVVSRGRRRKGRDMFDLIRKRLGCGNCTIGRFFSMSPPRLFQNTHFDMHAFFLVGRGTTLSAFFAWPMAVGAGVTPPEHHPAAPSLGPRSAIATPRARGVSRQAAANNHVHCQKWHKWMKNKYDSCFVFSDRARGSHILCFFFMHGRTAVSVRSRGLSSCSAPRPTQTSCK